MHLLVFVFALALCADIPTLSAHTVKNPLRAPAALAACGPQETPFAFDLKQGPFAISSPRAEMALVYVITQDQAIPFSSTPITKVGMDGNWIGANHFFSYLMFEVPPGVHHLCVTMQSRGSRILQGLAGVKTHVASAVALANFDARPGITYFFRNLSVGAGDYFMLLPVNRDEAKMLLNAAPESISHPK